MQIKDKIIIGLITLLTIVVFFLIGFVDTNYNKASVVYQVYLNGNKLGLIASKDELYDIINSKQSKMKNKYKVDNVYPPNGFTIEKKMTYDEDLISANDVYKKIEEQDDFTIKGYVVTVKSTDYDDNGNEVDKVKTINVISQKVFEDAIDDYVLAFFDDEQDYYNYINNNQEEIVDTGKIIEAMYFDEQVTIKEAYISVNDKIFTDKTELSQYLLFGENSEMKTYTVKEGDTLTKIAEDHELNANELLIANPKYKSEDTLLAVGDQVNTTLINPVISLTYEVHEVVDEEQYFEKKVVYDNSKPSSYQEITTPGVTGITRLTEKYKVTNGEESEGIVKIDEEVIIAKVDQVTTKGKKHTSSTSYNPAGITGSYIASDGTWGWPTNSGYKITSGYKYRWGKMHTAIDISGTGKGSPIYAARDGIVVTAETGSGSAWSLGKYVVIRHDGNYYTQYAHLNTINVRVGQTVKKGQRIGAMGDSGHATGVHLHFGVSIGEPYRGGSFMNPLKLYK